MKRKLINAITRYPKYVVLFYDQDNKAAPRESLLRQMESVYVHHEAQQIIVSVWVKAKQDKTRNKLSSPMSRQANGV